ncbi:MAG: protein of unknown function, putative coiled-coil domain [Pseudonocardiales bacterium]|nr:protein of unknown function, putative coiled-coil domain [Pseudonocardiales bacterium]
MTISDSSTLAEEHELLMREVATRAAALLKETDEGRFPQPELQELLNYLHLEVLRQAANEQWLLFRSDHHDPVALARLRRDQLDLRLAIDTLSEAAATAAGGAPTLTADQLAAITRDLTTQIECYFADGEALLAAAGAAAPATALLGARPHEWYDATEGPVIDLDSLHGARRIDAVMARLLRLLPSERIELRSTVNDPSPIWQRLVRVDPGGYGIVYLERGPGAWRVELTRRPDGWTPHPLA